MSAEAREAKGADRAIHLAVGFLGALVVLLSFMPWMASGYGTLVRINGNEVKGLTDVGDGWATAIAGGAATFVATAALRWNLRGQLVASVIVICGLLIAGVAGYDLVNGLYEPGSRFIIGGYFSFQVRREPALWATAVTGVGIAIAGMALLLDANRRQPIPDSLNEARETEGWA
jgi:hypothetical protein